MNYKDTTELLMKWKDIKADENLSKPFVYSGSSALQKQLESEPEEVEQEKASSGFSRLKPLLILVPAFFIAFWSYLPIWFLARLLCYGWLLIFLGIALKPDYRFVRYPTEVRIADNRKWKLTITSPLTLIAASVIIADTVSLLEEVFKLEQTFFTFLYSHTWTPPRGFLTFWDCVFGPTCGSFGDFCWTLAIRFLTM